MNIQQSSYTYLFVFCLFIISFPACFAFGPGGVSTNLERWYAGNGIITTDAAGNSDAADGDLVAYWGDDSSNSADAVQSTDAAKPVYRASGWNGQPFLEFDGSADFLPIGSLSGLANNSYTVFVVGVRDDASANYLLGAESTTTNGNLILGYSSNTEARLDQHTNAVTTPVSAFDAPEQPFILTGVFDSSSGHSITELRDATETTVSNTNTTVLTGTVDTVMGRHVSEYFKGELYEVAIYSGTLSTANFAKVYQFLALKYGLTLSSDYLSSSDVVIFDQDAESALYSNGIAGVGRDDGLFFELETSTSSHDGVLTVSAPLPPTMAFLMWGHDDQATILVRDDVPIGVTSRTERIWRFQRTGATNDATLSFDLNEMGIVNTRRFEDFTLLVSSGDNFSSSTTYDATSISNGVVSFSSIPIDDSDYIALGVKKAISGSLGGILRNVRLWLDAEDMSVLHTDLNCSSEPPSNHDAIRCWRDKSPYGSHVTVPQGDCVSILGGTQTCAAPTFEIDQFGDGNTLQFTRDNREALRADLASNNQDWIGSAITMFIAFQQDGVAQTSWSFFSNGNDISSGINFQFDVNEDGGDHFFRLNGLNSQNPVFEEVNNFPNLFSFRATSSQLDLFSDGDLVEIATHTSLLGTEFNQYRLNQNRAGNNGHNARIAEIVIFDAALSNCELSELDLYFGNKYHRPFGGGIPGGVRCEEVHVWFDGSRGVTHDSDGVSLWLDEGHNTDSATQTNNANKPTLVEDLFNNHDSIHFDGSDVLEFSADHMPQGNGARSYFIVARPSGASGKAVLSHGTIGSSMNVTLDITQTEVSVDSDGHVYGFTREPETDLELVTFELEEGAESDAWEIRVNGEAHTERTISGGPHVLNTGGTDARIGAKVGAPLTNQYDGELAELFVYDRVFSDVNRARVETYFALRYGITLHHTNDYVDSHDRVVYNSTGTESGYTSHIAGIVDDEAEHLIQYQSKSQHNGAHLTIGVSDTATLEDEEYLIWGHNRGSLIATEDDVPTGLQARLGRIWKFRETGGETGDLTVELDLTGITLFGAQASDFKLIKDTDTTFSTGATVIDASSMTDNVLTFSNVDIDDGEYVTFGSLDDITSSATGPGGVMDDLWFWLRADSMISTLQGTNTIDTWGSAGPSSSVGAFSTGTTAVNFLADTINTHPTLVFSGGDSFLTMIESGGLLAHDAVVDTGAVVHGGDGYALFAVGVRQDAGESTIIGIGDALSSSVLRFGYSADATALIHHRSDDGLVSLSGAVPAFTTSEPSPFLLHAAFSTTDGQSVTEFRDGSVVTSANTTPPFSGINAITVTDRSSNSAVLARSETAPDDFFNGMLSEMIAFSEPITEAEARRVRSYLAIKYGFTLAEDYVDSGGTVIFDTDGDHSGYAHDILGVGRDDMSGLAQEESGPSRTPNPLFFISNPSSMDDGDFLFFGHNGGAVTLTHLDIPLSVTDRINRVWSVQNTGDIGEVTLSFDFQSAGIISTRNIQDFVLLVSDDETFHDARIESATAIADGIVQFTMPFTTNDKYISFGVRRSIEASLGGVFHDLRLWLDSEDEEVLHTDLACSSDSPSDEDNILCWRDKSPFASHVTVPQGDCRPSTPGEQTCHPPSYQADVIGSLDFLRFNASPGEALRADLEGSGTEWVGDTFTFFIVFYEEVVLGATYNFFSNGSADGTDSDPFSQHFELNYSSSNNMYDFLINQVGAIARYRVFGSGAALNNFEFRLFGFRATPTEVDLFSEGELVSSTSFTTARGREFDQYRLNQNRGTGFSNSNIAEIVIYESALSNCQIGDVDRYLGRKYHRPFGGGIPGGVRCEEVHVWFDGSRGVTHDNDGVSLWLDEGHNTDSATQTVNANKPTLVEDLFNNHDSIHFDGSDVLEFSADHMPQGNGARSYFIVARPSGASGKAVLSHGTIGSSMNVTLDITQTEVSVDSDGHVYGFTREPETDLELVTFELEEGAESDAWEIRVNGEAHTERTISGGPHVLNTGGTDARIGAKVGAPLTNQYDGELAELFVYDRVFSDVNRARVETYFALRYGITLHHTNDYVDSHDRVVYNSTGTESGYTSHIAGIVDDEAEHLIQYQSKSQHNGAHLTIGVSDTATLEDEEYLIWGHNRGSLIATEDDVPTGLQARLGRIWKFRETGGETGDLTVELDLTGITLFGAQASDFKLIKDTDTTFSTGATVIDASSMTDNVLTFSNVDIDDGEYVTFGSLAMQTILAVTVINDTNDTVDVPSVNFGSLETGPSTQTTNGLLGTNSQRIVVINGTGNASWSLSIAAESTDSVWEDGVHSFDFNDSISDGSDTDTVGGGLTVNPSSITITPSDGCSSTGIASGGQTTFSEGTTDTITLVSAGSSAGTDCSWELTNVQLSQQVPPGQTNGTYALTMTLTVVAQ